jgi:hypothetical protein
MQKPNHDLQAAIDTRLEEALVHANYRTTLNIQKQNARLKLENALVYATSGGTFQINPALISFAAALVTGGKTSVTLLDVNANPIQIEDISEFYQKILDIYSEALNDYTIQIKTLGKARTTKAVVGAR